MNFGQDILGALSALTPLAQIAAILGLFLLLVVPHEGGHFTLAKLFRVHVIEYSVGMGTKLWSTVRSGTMYAIRAFPLGGFVRLGGMEADDHDDPDGFHTKPAYQRLLILLAGSGVNFLVAVVLVTGISLGQLNDDPGKVTQVTNPSPAYQAGLRPGDSVRAVNGHPVAKPADIARAEDSMAGQPLQFRVRRQDGTVFDTTVRPVSVVAGIWLDPLSAVPGRVGQVEQPSSAFDAGIRPGDTIRTVNGVAVARPEDLAAAAGSPAAQPVRLTVHRQDGSDLTASVTPQVHWRMGISSPSLVSLGDALLNGITFPVKATAELGLAVYMVASGQLPGGFFGPNGVAGPIGFSVLVYHAAGEGLLNFLGVAAYLSIALGLTNLLPLPALDGGRIMVVLLEKLRGRPFDREKELQVQRYGLVALFALMALVAFFDVQRIASGQFHLR